MPGSVEGLLTVDFPEVGGVIAGPFVVTGASFAEPTDYLLTGGGAVVLAESTPDVVDGVYTVTVEFTNTCCTEMELEVFGDDGPAVTVPLAFPESG